MVATPGQPVRPHRYLFKIGVVAEGKLQFLCWFEFCRCGGSGRHYGTSDGSCVSRPGFGRVLRHDGPRSGRDHSAQYHDGEKEVVPKPAPPDIASTAMRFLAGRFSQRLEAPLDRILRSRRWCLLSRQDVGAHSCRVHSRPVEPDQRVAILAHRRAVRRRAETQMHGSGCEHNPFSMFAHSSRSQRRRRVGYFGHPVLRPPPARRAAWWRRSSTSATSSTRSGRGAA